jgi:hypothetical protein
MAQKIVIDLHNGTKLVAEEGCDSAYPNKFEVFVFAHKMSEDYAKKFEIERYRQMLFEEVGL